MGGGAEAPPVSGGAVFHTTEDPGASLLAAVSRLPLALGPRARWPSPPAEPGESHWEWAPSNTKAVAPSTSHLEESAPRPRSVARFDGNQTWEVVVKGRILIVIGALALVAGACSSDDSSDTTVTSAPSTTTTTEAATTTTAPATTTTAAPTTTTTTAPAPPATTIAETPIVGVLSPYNAGGAELFPPESVEAHWYQWDNQYIVLYRGFDASDGTPICAGNSAQEASGFNYITNSPHNGTVEEICDGVPKVAEEPVGVYSCGALLYYITEIPTSVGANLFGTLELVPDGPASAAGHTSFAPTDISVTPEFEPGLPAYELPPTAVDDLGTVVCTP